MFTTRGRQYYFKINFGPCNKINFHVTHPAIDLCVSWVLFMRIWCIPQLQQTLILKNHYRHISNFFCETDLKNIIGLIHSKMLILTSTSEVWTFSTVFND